MSSIISKELGFADLDKTCAKQCAWLWSCLKLAPSDTGQVSFARNWPVLLKTWTLCKTLCTTVLLLKISVKTFCATVAQRAWLCRCLKFAPNHTAQFFFALTWFILLKIWDMCQNKVCNCCITQKWRQNILHNYWFGANPKQRHSRSRWATVVQNVLRPILSNKTVAHSVLHKF